VNRRYVERKRPLPPLKVQLFLNRLVHVKGYRAFARQWVLPAMPIIAVAKTAEKQQQDHDQ
jgi:hypothetical protein